MVAKYVVVVHNRKWGDYFKEFDKKADAIKYRCECNFDLNTYAWLYKYVEVTEEMEEKIAEKMEKNKSQKTTVDPLKELEDELNKAHKEYLKYKPKEPGYKEAKERYLTLANEYEKAFKKSLKTNG